MNRSLVLFLFLSLSFASFADEGSMKIPRIWNVSHYDYNFEGRSSSIKEMIKLMKQGNNIISITGMGGIGKTQLAKRIAELCKEDYEIIWWYDAKKDLDIQIKDLASHWNEYIAENQDEIIDTKNLSVKRIKEKLKNNLRVTKHCFLLIFDDVSSIDEIAEYIPVIHDHSNSQIILTSRNSNISDKTIKLNNFDRKESVRLLMRLIKNLTLEEADRLSDELDDYPLALSQGASYIRSHSGMSINEYLELLRKKLSLLWKEEEEMLNKSSKDYKNSVDKALRISIDAIKEESQAAYKLLMLCALLNNQNIPEDLLLSIYNSNKGEVYKAISILEQYSIIDKNTAHSTVSNPSTYIMHEITQKVVLNNMNQTEIQNSLQYALEGLISIVPKKIDFLISFIVENPYYLQHLEKVKEYCDKEKIYNSQTLELNQRILEYYLPGARDFKKAEKLIQDMNIINSKITNVPVPLSLRFDVMRAALLAWKDYNIKGSIAMLNKASKVAQSSDLFPEERLMVYNRLVQEYMFIGDIENAEKYSDLGQELLLNTKEFIGNQDTFYLARTRIAIDKGDLEGAEHNLRITLEKTADLFKKIPFAAKLPALTLEMDVLNRQGNFKIAHEKAEKTLKEAEKYIEDKNHVYFARIKTYLGISALGIGNIDQAKRAAIESIELFEKTDNYINSKFKILALLLLAEVYITEHKNIEAQDILLEAERITSKNYTHFKIDDISKMYALLAKNSIYLNDQVLAQYYFDMHKKIFGLFDKRTIELAESLNL